MAGTARIGHVYFVGVRRQLCPYDFPSLRGTASCAVCKPHVHLPIRPSAWPKAQHYPIVFKNLRVNTILEDYLIGSFPVALIGAFLVFDPGVEVLLPFAFPSPFRSQPKTEAGVDENSAYDDRSASVIRLSNGMVLYLKEVGR